MDIASKGLVRGGGVSRIVMLIVFKMMLAITVVHAEGGQHSPMSGMFAVSSPHQEFAKKIQGFTKERKAQAAIYWDVERDESSRIWVSYSDDFLVRRAIDFGKEQVHLSYQGKALQQSSPESIRNDAEALLMIDLQSAYQQGEYLTFEKKASPRYLMTLLNLDSLEGLYQSASFDRKSGLKGDVLTVSISLPKNSTRQRAATIQPIVEREVKAKKIDAALVMAIIHQQSGFNVLAKSSQPKFGLMQLEPKHLLGEGRSMRLLNGKKIYDPQYNIKRGVALLVKLEKQLSGINDAEVKRLCLIAAYSVGISELARLFTGKPSLQKALSLINRLSEKQVRGQLYGKIEGAEKGRYVQQVSLFLAEYDDL